MRYTVWCRNRLIGDTDLGFVRIIDQSRSGWFHPNAEGERVMPVIASVLPALRAYLHRDAVNAAGESLVQAALHKSTLFADLAEAFQHLQSLELELRREDGSVVPTSDIGIQDTQHLIELAEELDDDVDVESWEADDELDELTGSWLGNADDISDVDEPEQSFDERDASGMEWMSEDLQEPQLPRYQIHVRLVHDDAIP